MATTAQTAQPGVPFFDDRVIRVSASGLSTANAGDWVAASGTYAFAADVGFIATPSYKVSGLGIAMEYNPTFDPLGRGINNSGFTVLRRGVLRVTAGNSGSARTIPIGSFCFPSSTGSGIVGQTGATGVGAIWVTAPPQGISANPTGALASGIGVVINHPVGGDSGIGQLDVVFNLATNVGYF